MSDLEYENARLRVQNHELLVLCTELRLQLTCTNAEMELLRRKKSSLERTLQDLQAEVAAWIEDHIHQRTVFERPHFLPLLLDNRITSIEAALQVNNNECVLLTAASEPFHVEYTNREWIEFCGWESHEILGLDCAFFQGPETSRDTTAKLMEDLRETGLGRMRITNYKKNGTRFNATVSVYPVYDTTTRGEPYMTHMAAYFSDVEELPATAPELKDLRHNCKSVWPTPSLSKKQFLSFASRARLNDLLRYTTTTEDAIILTDNLGRIVHTNRAWTELCQYTLREVEGQTCAFLQGPMTDVNTITASNKLLRDGRIVDMRVFNYAQDGSAFLNHLTIVPVYSSTQPSKVTHFIGHLQPTSFSSSSTDIDKFSEGLQRLFHLSLSAFEELHAIPSSSAVHCQASNSGSGVTDLSLSSGDESFPSYSSDSEDSEEEDMQIV